MKFIYELQRIDIWGQRYPRRRTNITTMGYFSTHKKAIGSLQNFVCDLTNYDLDTKHPTWLGFIITQYALDRSENNFVAPVYQCTYTHEGQFNDENLVGIDGVFRGRPTDRLRFHKGDIVEVCEGDYATLGIVYGTPLSPERCEKLSTPDDCGRFIELDRNDDQCTILFLSKEDYLSKDNENKSADEEFCPIHDHIQSQFLFKPTKPVSESLKTRLLNLL